MATSANSTDDNVIGVDLNNGVDLTKENKNVRGAPVQITKTAMLPRFGVCDSPAQFSKKFKSFS